MTGRWPPTTRSPGTNDNGRYQSQTIWPRGAPQLLSFRSEARSASREPNRVGRRLPRRGVASTRGALLRSLQTGKNRREDGRCRRGRGRTSRPRSCSRARSRLSTVPTGQPSRCASLRGDEGPQGGEHKRRTVAFWKPVNLFVDDGKRARRDPGRLRNQQWAWLPRFRRPGVERLCTRLRGHAPSNAIEPVRHELAMPERAPFHEGEKVT